jgi:hypothetical protein
VDVGCKFLFLVSSWVEGCEIDDKRIEMRRM